MGPLQLVCLAHGLRATGDRAWNFILPIVLMSGSHREASGVNSGSLAPVSVLALAQSCGVIALGPFLARRLSINGAIKWRTLVSLVLLENAAVACGGSALLIASDGSGNAGQPLLLSPWSWLGLGLMAVDSAVSSVLSLLVEKEYIRQLFGGADQRDLAKANAMVVRTDLLASVATYSALAVLVGLFTPPGAGKPSYHPLLATLVAWHVVAAVAVTSVLGRLQQSTGILSGGDGEGSQPPDAGTSSAPWYDLSSGLRELRSVDPRTRLRVAAFVLLFFTVLSPSGLLSAWLSANEVGAGDIAWFRAAAQLAGGVGTFVAPAAIAAWGLTGAAAALQLGQLTFVLVAAGTAACAPAGSAGLPWYRVFMLAVATSRIGLWGFDLCERQIVQVRRPPQGRLSGAAGGLVGAPLALPCTISHFLTLDRRLLPFNVVDGP